jgi:hypothetical protein
MAKKSSKASSLSWRTLMRRARLADAKGHGSAAKRLRTMASNIRHGKVTAKPKAPSSRSKAAEALRAQRMDDKIKAKTSGGNGGSTPRTAIGGAGGYSVTEDEAANSNLNQRGLPSTAPGQGEIVGGFDDVMTAKLMKLARQKGGDILVKTEIMQIQATARYEGERKRDAEAVKTLKEVQRATDEKIVCSFLAEVETAQKLTRGLPPDQVWLVASLTLVKIVDALNRAGYTAKGLIPGYNRATDREAFTRSMSQGARLGHGA